MPDRLKQGRSLRLKVGPMDAEEEGDQNALGIVSVGLIVIEKCTINCPDIMQGGCIMGSSYNNIMLIRVCAVCCFIWIGFVIVLI